jgi:hypothetical protein
MRNYPDERRAMHINKWPTADSAGWTNALKPPGPFGDKVGNFAHIRDVTRKQYENSYGRWLTWLAFADGLDHELSAEARATPENVVAFYDCLVVDGLRPYTIANHMVGLASVLSGLSRTHDVAYIRTAANRVRATGVPFKDKSEGLPSADALFQVGVDLMNEAEVDDGRPLTERALVFRDGLLIAFLTLRPVRIKNVAMLSVGGELERTESGWLLSFRADQMKNGKAFACAWPPVMVAPLERYLEVYRTHLQVPGIIELVQPLWLTKSGNRMQHGDIHHNVKRWTKERLGIAITPHKFRHATATTMGTEHPDDTTSIAPLLQHSTPKTSQHFYNMATGVRAGQVYQAVVAKKRGRPETHRSAEAKILPLISLLEGLAPASAVAGAAL